MQESINKWFFSNVGKAISPKLIDDTEEKAEPKKVEKPKRRKTKYVNRRVMRACR